MNRLKGKTVLITGATSGIGKSSAGQFAKEGCNLILTGRREDRLKALASYLQKTYEIQVKFSVFDIRDYDACKTFVGSLTSEVDILLNNAGLAKGVDPVYDAKIDDWEQMIDTNVKGLLYLTRLISPQMKAKNSGQEEKQAG